MRPTIICFIAALLAGCASHPDDSKLQGARHSSQHTTVVETSRGDTRWTNARSDKVERFPAELSINKSAGRGDFLFIELRLDTGESLPFSVDTGSPITLVDISLEPTLGKRLGTMPVGMVGHAQQKAGCYAAPKLWLGDVPLQTGSNVWVYDFKQPRGILGMDCLKNYCVQLDFQTGTMRFLDSEHLDTAELGKAFPLILSYTGPQGQFVRPTIQHVGLVGDDTNLLVDTGCRIDGLTERGAMWNVIWGGLLRPFGKGGLHSCVWDGANYTGIKIAPVGDANVLGLRFLARHLVTLDFPGRTLYLKQTSVGPLNSARKPDKAAVEQPRCRLTQFDLGIIDAHRQLYGMSCIPSSVEMVLKLLGRVPLSYYDLQTQWKEKADGSFKDFDGKTFAGVTFHQQFTQPHGPDFPLAKLFDTINAELHAGRFVIVGLASGDDTHDWVIYDEAADGEFLAVSKAGAHTIEERHVKRVITSMKGTDIGTYELHSPSRMMR